MSRTIINHSGPFWKCRRFSRQFKTLQNKLITHGQITPSASSCVTNVICPSFSSEQTDVPSMERKSFDELMFSRRRQAHCSVIVEVTSYYTLCQLCKQIEKTSKVKSLFYRELNSEKKYFLIECENHSDVRALLRKCRYPELSDSVPVHSRLLCYNDSHINREESFHIPCEVYENITDSEINKKLLESANIDEQMKKLQRCERLSEINSRLQFFICSQIEDCMSGLFPDSICLPFGSAVNGFGCASGDLDMNLNLYGKQVVDDSSLYFIAKRTLAYDRFQGQRMLETIGDMLQTFVPGISHILRILKARIPILKFQHEIAKIQCDLTINNMTGVYMAELLYQYGEMDSRVGPLVHTVRRWARKNELTSDGAGTKITNFSLILMIVFFLQTRSNPILPPISRIKQHSTETIGTSTTINENMNPHHEDTSDLGLLLVEFLVFCIKFNYNEAMSLVTATRTHKPDYNSLYIHNPIEGGLNVSRNVTSSELKKFIDAAKNALWQLEKSFDKNNDCEPWGILNLFIGSKNLPNDEYSRKFQISTLFDKETTTSKQSPSEKRIVEDYMDVNNISNGKMKTRNKKTQKRKFKT